MKTERDARGRSYTVQLDGSPQTLYEGLDAKSYSLKVQSDDGKSSHSLRLLHITSWADFGEVDEKVFGTLLDMVLREAGSSTCPIWTHCSAGIGRSGTVIGGLLARDLGEEGLRHLKAPDVSDVSAKTPAEVAILAATRIVDHERQYRPGMVQTPAQLAMVVKVVAGILQGQS